MKDAEFTIFYAWQSDSPSMQNRSAILQALTRATGEVETERGMVIIIDQATRDMLGADNVADSIRAKIEAADMFVGDVTTITPPPTEEAKTRPCPNPNVTFEIGYAVAHLGWNRCTLLLNTALADHKDLPFDFAQQRVSAFRISSAKDTGGVTHLATMLKNAINGVIDKKPKRPAELRMFDPTTQRRERDILAAKEALSQFSTTKLQSHIQNLPYSFSQCDLDFFENFAAVVSNVLFHINDPALNAAFRNLLAAWGQALSYPGVYRNAGDRLIFSNVDDIPLNDNQNTIWKVIETAGSKMQSALNDLLRIIREDYVEIDLIETNKSALKQWQQEQIKLAHIFQKNT